MWATSFVAHLVVFVQTTGSSPRLGLPFFRLLMLFPVMLVQRGVFAFALSGIVRLLREAFPV